MNQAIYEQLKLIARQGNFTTYGEIAPLAHLDLENPADRNKIADFLGEISTYEHEQKRPMLSVLVINRERNMPGPGFFALAKALGVYKGTDDMQFFTDEMRRVHNYWKQA